MPPSSATADRIGLPGKPEEITSEWLTAALEVETPGVEVTSAFVGDVIWGTATKVRVMCAYNEAGHAAGLPPTLVVKAGFGGHELSAEILVAYRREVEFYRELAPRLDLGLPRCLFAGMDEGSGQALVVLEDMLAANTIFSLPGETKTPETAAAALDFQARYHAATWGLTGIQGIESAHDYPGDLRALLLRVLSGEYWAKSLAKPRAESVPEALRGPEGMSQAIQALWEWDAEHAVCLMHGDAHVGNMFVERDGTTGFLDWQMTGRGHWAHDVAYFVISALDPDQRRRSERGLLEGYLAKLGELGASPPSFDEAWDAYSRHAVHGLLWAANADGMYEEEINRRMVERYAIAVEDLGTLPLLLG